jgi:hypothetical protein
MKMHTFGIMPWVNELAGKPVAGFNGTHSPLTNGIGVDETRAASRCGTLLCSEATSVVTTDSVYTLAAAGRSRHQRC